VKALASTQSSRSPLAAENASIPILVVLSLHVGLFLLIAGVLLPADVDMRVFSPGLKAEYFLFVFAVLYLLLGLVGVVPSYGRRFGLALSAVTVPFLVLLLAADWATDGSLPRSGWFIVLSLLDSLAIVITLLLLRIIAHLPHVQQVS